MTETRPTSEDVKIEPSAEKEKQERLQNFEKEKQEQLRRLWMMIFVKNATENYPGFDLRDIAQADKELFTLTEGEEIVTDDDAIIKTILDKYDNNREGFKDFFRAKGRFEFAVHKKAYGEGPDFDGLITLEVVLKKAGIDIGKPELVETGQEPPKNKIGIELGGLFGIKIPKGWNNIKDRTVLVDHHLLGSKEEQITEGYLQPEEEGMITKISVAQMFYEGMNSLGLYDHLPPEEQEALKKMVQFVSQADNLNYPGQHQKEAFRNSDKTVLGLYRFINSGKVDELFEYFKDGGDPTKELSDNGLRRLGLIYKSTSGQHEGKPVNRSEQRKEAIEKSLKMIEKKVAVGFLVKVPFGDKILKFLVDYIPQDASKEEKDGIPLRPEATFASGYDGIILYNEKTHSYFINLHPESEKILDTKLPQGVNVRNKMLIKNVADKRPLQISLRDLLGKLGVDIYTILKTNNGLATAIEKNEQWMKTDRTIASEKPSTTKKGVEEPESPKTQSEQTLTDDKRTKEPEPPAEQPKQQPPGTKEKSKEPEKRIGEIFEITNKFTKGERHWGLLRDENPTGKDCVVEDPINFIPKEDVVYQVEISRYNEKMDIYLIKVTEKKEPIKYQEKWIDAAQIIWYKDERKPENSHWSIPSDVDFAEKGHKHVIITKAPEDFDPEKLPQGSKVLFRILNEIPKIIFAEIVETKGLEQQAEQKTESDDREQTPETPPKIEIKEQKYENARLLFENEDWIFLLPDGRKVLISDELKDKERQLNGLYAITVKISEEGGKLLVIEMEPMLETTEEIVSEKVDGTTQGDGDDIDDQKGKKGKDKPWRGPNKKNGGKNGGEE